MKTLRTTTTISVLLRKSPDSGNDYLTSSLRIAAERAVRLNEEQSRISQSRSARTDEGESSDEETYESHAARIKARVSELTGNMDGQPAPGLRR